MTLFFFLGGGGGYDAEVERRCEDERDEERVVLCGRKEAARLSRLPASVPLVAGSSTACDRQQHIFCDYSQ